MHLLERKGQAPPAGAELGLLDCPSMRIPDPTHCRPAGRQCKDQSLALCGRSRVLVGRVLVEAKKKKDFWGGSEQRTFKGREATVEDELKIAKLALGQHDGCQCLGLSGELGMARSVAGDQVLQDATMGRVRHCVCGRIRVRV